MDIPLADMDFFKSLIRKMGWKYETTINALAKYIATRPTGVDLSDSDILNELKAVRYE